jgi:hypothetical protein
MKANRTVQRHLVTAELFGAIKQFIGRGDQIFPGRGVHRELGQTQADGDTHRLAIFFNLTANFSGHALGLGLGGLGKKQRQFIATVARHHIRRPHAPANQPAIS